MGCVSIYRCACVHNKSPQPPPHHTLPTYLHNPPPHKHTPKQITFYALQFLAFSILPIFPTLLDACVALLSPLRWEVRQPSCREVCREDIHRCENIYMCVFLVMDGVGSISPMVWCGVDRSVSQMIITQHLTPRLSLSCTPLGRNGNKHDEQARPYSATGQWLPDYSSATAAATAAVPSTGAFAYNRQETHI